jgi:hypothetical protein
MKNDVAMDIFTGVILSFPIVLLMFIITIPIKYGVLVYSIFSGITATFLSVASSQNTKELGEAALPVQSVVWNSLSWPVFWTLILGVVLKDSVSK